MNTPGRFYHHFSKNNDRKILASAAAAAVLLLLAPATLSFSGTSAQGQQQIVINGAGATFPFPLIDTWRVEYKKVNPSVDLNYQSIGSGGGIKQFTERTVDFGASDAPLTETEEQALPAPAVHIPETIGSVVAAYNVEGLSQPLRLTGPVLADIFLGRITSWNDPAIAEINPGANLPNRPILTVHRSDGSGTTFVWTSYLSQVSPAWEQQVGAGKSVQWPVGIGAPGNEGVSASINQTPNSIGYVELAYAVTTGMEFADIQNRDGQFVTPSLESTRAAVEAASENLPAGDESWTDVSLLNAPGANSYPIASFSYLLLYKEMSTSIDSAEQARALAEFIAWAISPEGQQHAEELSYVPLPDNVVRLNMETLAGLTFDGEPVIDIQLPTDGRESSASAEYGGTTYTVTASSDTAQVTSVTINEAESIVVEFEGTGPVELTIPTSMVEGISGVTVVDGGQAVEFEEVGATDGETTISFTLPEGEGASELEITGARVVPEFGAMAVAALALAGSLAAYAWLARSGRTPSLWFR